MKLLLTFGALVAAAVAIPMPLRREDLIDGIVSLPFAKLLDDDGVTYRLPNQTKPLHYDITLTTHIHDEGREDFSHFSGVVKITIKPEETTKVITLHKRQITIESVKVWDNEEETFEDVLNFTEDDDREFLIIPTEKDLVITEQYIVEIAYVGQLRDDNMGFYRSSYKNADDQTVWIATTQFEQTDARHAFPCYDEPQIRATFEIKIIHHNSYTAISNWPGTDSDPDAENYVTTTFDRTHPVQTYLIAFIVSDFDSANNAAKSQRVFARPQAISNGEADLALDAGVKILDEFVSHLRVEYDLPKMDQVAVPDFDAGAMENWGLVTYREEYLLYNGALATRRQRENILTIISHEFAHQWFGDHVSPLWWSYLWLNEGFATLYGNFLPSLIEQYKEERLMDLYVVETVQAVFDVDASPSIRPMTHYVEDPESIANLFDNIAYSKSGSVLRMMQEAIGDDVWTNGLEMYLKTMEFKSASSVELYEGLQTAVDAASLSIPASIATIMGSWETQSGFPLITVTRNGDVVTIEQERFFFETTASPALWWVPINFVVASAEPDFTETKPDFWLEGVKSVTINNAAQPDNKKWTDDDWMIFNKQESSYYRVNYDQHLWDLLVAQLRGDEFGKIHLLNRAQLVDDSLSLARAGKIDYQVPLDILEYLEKEFDYIPWASANRGLTLLNRWLSGSDVYSSYQTYVRKVVAPLFTHFGVEIKADDPKLDRYARSLAITVACQAGLPACLEQTASKLQEIVADTSKSIDPDLQASIYCNGLRQDAGDSKFNFLYAKMLASEDQAERTLIINALGCSQDASRLKTYLETAFGNEIRLQEKWRVLVSPVNNGELGLTVMMDLIRDRHAEINLIAADQISIMCSNIAARVSSEATRTVFSTLLDQLQASNHLAATSVDDLKAVAGRNLEWQQKYLPSFRVFFDLPEPSTETPTTTEGSTTAATTTTDGAGSVIVSAVVLTFCALIKYLM